VDKTGYSVNLKLSHSLKSFIAGKVAAHKSNGTTLVITTKRTFLLQIRRETPRKLFNQIFYGSSLIPSKTHSKGLQLWVSTKNDSRHIKGAYCSPIWRKS
jgi:hypothetical protein